MSVEWFDQPKGDPPVLVDPDPAWAEAGRDWVARLGDALAALDVRIEHVGSTAVPGLAAKPVLDLQVAVPALHEEDSYRPGLEALGLVLRARAPDHRFFRPPASLPRTVHVHVCEHGSAWEREHLLFRDFLRAHAEQRRRYESVKRGLAASQQVTRATYAAGKAEFIADLLAEARRWAGAAP